MENTIQKSNIYPLAFDEAEYLHLNPDVGEAVRDGKIPSGLDHYEKMGHIEDRWLGAEFRSPPPIGLLSQTEFCQRSRRSRTLANLDLQKLSGMEIGALCFPMVTHREGCIFYVDFATTKELRKKYSKDSIVDISKIVEVDAIWGERSLKKCVGRQKFDYVVASHVVEHVPDLISWFREIGEVLKTNGSLRLAVPDRRYTFDYLRHESALHDLLDAYINKSRRPTSRQILEHYDLARNVNHLDAWNGDIEPKALERKYPENEGLRLAKKALKSGNYNDVHCWIFTPQSFANLMLRLAESGLLKFICETFVYTNTAEIEFFVHMSPCKSKADIVNSWKVATSNIPNNKLKI